MGVLHHMANDLDIVMDNINGHLNSEGIVIFSEPNSNFLNSIEKFGIDYQMILIMRMSVSIKEIDFYAGKNF